MRSLLSRSLSTPSVMAWSESSVSWMQVCRFMSLQPSSSVTIEFKTNGGALEELLFAGRPWSICTSSSGHLEFLSAIKIELIALNAAHTMYREQVGLFKRPVHSQGHRNYTPLNVESKRNGFFACLCLRSNRGARPRLLFHRVVVRCSQADVTLSSRLRVATKADKDADLQSQRSAGTAHARSQSYHSLH